MTDDSKLKLIIKSLREYALGDINRASFGGSKMGAFILCSCLIEAIAGFIKGADTNRDNYKAFVRDYLQNYDPEALYTDLRCKLVHSYSEGGSYLFVDAKPHLHLKQNSGRTIINLEDLISDIEKALNKIEGKLLDVRQTQLRKNAIGRFDKNGVIVVFALPTSPMTTEVPPVTGAPI
jgi:hypothetical protein